MKKTRISETQIIKALKEYESGTSARQFIDSMISDVYQLIILEPKELNYHVLVSLNSFNKYVTKSIRQALFNADIENSLS